MHLGTKSSLGQSGQVQSVAPTPPVYLSRLLFHGATSALGGTDYRIGQLIHNVTIDSSGNSNVLVSKTDNSTDVNISSFNNSGTVSSNLASSFVIRAIGNRNAVNSAIQGANTNDSVGVVGQGNPGKIDVFNGNQTEFITFEVVNLNPALTISIKKVYVIRANFIGTDKPLMVLTPFDPLGLSTGFPINSSGGTIFPITVSSSQMDLVGTGTGTNGNFKTGVSSLEGGNVGYGLYAIDFDVINTPSGDPQNITAFTIANPTCGTHTLTYYGMANGKRAFRVYDPEAENYHTILFSHLGYWIYECAGYGVIATSSDTPDYPWEATWSATMTFSNYVGGTP